MIEIDGSIGEGGGQILRTSVSLAVLLKKPVRITRIRRLRRNPGLGIQHLTALRAAAAISHGSLAGDRIGSQEITFHPGELRGGDYRFDVSESRGSAGSVSLIFQTILLPLFFAPEPSTVELIGGTHVPLSPPYHYLERVFLPLLRRMGAEVDVSLLRWGWYPIGKGEMTARIRPIERLLPVRFDRKEPIQKLRGISASSNLPGHVRERQRREADRLLARLGIEVRFEEHDGPALGRGSFVLIHTDGMPAGFSSLGAPRKPAEQVAKEAVDEFEAFYRTTAPCDPFIVDQIVSYLALAEGDSSIHFSRLTLHLLTQAGLVARFLPGAELILEGKEGEPGTLRTRGIGPFRRASSSSSSRP